MASKQTQTNTTKSGVDPRMDGYFSNLYGQNDAALNAVDRGPLKTGSGVNIQAMLANLSSTQSPGRFVNLVNDAASGKYLDPATNPYLAGNIDATINPVTEQLTRQLLPNIRHQGIASGAFGGDRGALVEGQAMGDWAQAAGNIRAQMLGDNYTRERGVQVAAQDMMPGAVQAETAVDNASISTEALLRGLQEQFAFAGLNPAAQILNTNPYKTQEQTQTQTTKPNVLTSLLQGGLGIGAMMSGLGGMGGLGGLAGLFGKAGSVASQAAGAFFPANVFSAVPATGLPGAAQNSNPFYRPFTVG